MPKSGLTDIVAVVDRSGSMSTVRSDAIGGFNTFISDQKSQPGDARVTLVLFNHEYSVPLAVHPIKEVPPLDASTYIPSGTTALLDAVGRAIDDAGKRLAAMPEAERPEKVIVAILTDGMENASKDYSRDRVFEMIKTQTQVYKWAFLFLAANQDAFQGAQSLGIPTAHAASFASTPKGTRMAFRGISCAVSAFRSGRDVDMSQGQS